MRSEVIERLVEINRTFYAALAEPFARTRARPQPGFEQLLAYTPKALQSVLDVGCGEGRFGRFLSAHFPDLEYVGVDFSSRLIEEARSGLKGCFYQRDLLRPGALQGLGQFDLVVSLAVLQHIPGRSNRVQLLRAMGEQVHPQGRLFLSTWQFMDSDRQRRKVVDWSEVALAADDVEENDYLLTWRGGGFGLRYVAYIDRHEVEAMAQAAGLIAVAYFRSDGKEGDLNLYSILECADAGSGY